MNKARLPKLKTVLSNALAVVTRNTADFVGTGVTLLNPFVAARPARMQAACLDGHHLEQGPPPGAGPLCEPGQRVQRRDSLIGRRLRTTAS